MFFLLHRQRWSTMALTATNIAQPSIATSSPPPSTTNHHHHFPLPRHHLLHPSSRHHRHHRQQRQQRACIYAMPRICEGHLFCLYPCFRSRDPISVCFSFLSLFCCSTNFFFN